MYEQLLSRAELSPQWREMAQRKLAEVEAAEHAEEAAEAARLAEAKAAEGRKAAFKARRLFW